MSSQTYSPDRWLWPLSPADDELQLVFDEDGTTFTVDIDVGGTAPYLAANFNFGNATYDALFSVFEGELNAAASGSYVVETATPDGAAVTDAGVQVRQTGGSQRFRLRWDDGATTIDPRIFGYDASRTTATAWSNDSSPTDRIVAPLSGYYSWTAPTAADDKRRVPKRVTFRSDSRVDSYQNTWVTDRRRRIQYRFLDSVHVWPSRGDIAAEASRSGLNTGDTHNGLFDLWEHLAAGGEAVIQHSDTSAGAAATDYEFVKLHGEEMRDQFWAALTEVDGGERYDLEWMVQVDEEASSYDY